MQRVADDPATFVLVHGAWHGSWCWERLVPELSARAHRAVTVDLPVDDGSATFDDYAGMVLNGMDGLGGPLVLVGHSLGAMTIPLAAEQHQVETLIFLCGVVPRLGGGPWDDGPEMGAPGIYDPLLEGEDGSTTWPTLESATAALYNDCGAADAAWAFAQLRAQNSSSLWGSPYPLLAWPQARRVSIVGTADRAVTLAWSRHVAATRLCVPAIELASGHSPMLSQPALLADTLIAARAG